MFTIPPRPPENASKKTRQLVDMISRATTDRVAESRHKFELELMARLKRQEYHIHRLLSVHMLEPSQPEDDENYHAKQAYWNHIDQGKVDLLMPATSATKLSEHGPASIALKKDDPFVTSLPILRGDSGRAHISDDTARRTTYSSDTQTKEMLRSEPSQKLDLFPSQSVISSSKWSGDELLTDDKSNISQNDCTELVIGTDVMEQPELEVKEQENCFRSISSGTIESLKHFSRVPHAHLAWWRDFDDPDSSIFAYVYVSAMNPLIFISVFLSVTSKFDPPLFTGDWVLWIQMMFDVLFVLEVLLRFLVAFNKVQFLTDVFNIIDLLAALPLFAIRASEGFEVYVAPDGNLAVSLIRSLGPVFKVCKILRRFPTFHLLINAFSDAMEALPFLMFVFGLIALTFASLLYVFEPRSNIPDFQTSAWLTVITMTTVGYGDRYPVTQAGKMIVGILVVIQVLYMALPLGILGQEFQNTWKLRHRFLAVKMVRTRMTALGLGLKDVRQFFRQFADSEGALDFDGFFAMVKSFGVNISERRMREVYKGFDEDGGGSIDEMEFILAVFPKEFKAFQEEEKRAQAEKRNTGRASVISHYLRSWKSTMFSEQ